MKRRWALSLLAFLLLLPASAQALKISPFKASLTEGSIVFRVENNSSEPAAVQVSAMTWDIALDGSEINNDAEDDFVIFPPQLVLKPGESRAVRVQYLGVLEGGREKAYRLVAEQLPVGLKDTPGAGSAVRFMLKFKAALYVTPGRVKSDVRAVSVQPSGGGKLRLLLSNQGTGHALMRDPKLSLTFADGNKLDVPASSLAPVIGENIHAGAERHFDFSADLAGRNPADITGVDFGYEAAF